MDYSRYEDIQKQTACSQLTWLMNTDGRMALFGRTRMWNKLRYRIYRRFIGVILRDKDHQIY